jgi:hypothetical protein
MKLGRLLQIALIAAAVLMLAASASASTINYTTNAPNTIFASGAGTITNAGLTLDSNGGTVSATLTFVPNSTSGVGVPSNIDLGDFLVVCAACTTQAVGTGDATFGAFTFDLVVTDSTDVATGEYVGSSGGGLVFSNESTISISWLPLQLGPAGAGALTGNFGPTFFIITSPTGIVAPNSGTPQGDTTVQGFVSSTAVPEPATMAMVGGLLIGLAALARKRRA